MTMMAGAEVEEAPSLMVGRRVAGDQRRPERRRRLSTARHDRRRGHRRRLYARQASIDRTVAVKMLKSDKTTDQHQGEVPLRSGHHRRTRPPEHRPDLRPRAYQQGSYFYSMNSRGRHALEQGHPNQDARREHRNPDEGGRRRGVRPLAQRRPPRLEARERDARQLR